MKSASTELRVPNIISFYKEHSPAILAGSIGLDIGREPLREVGVVLCLIVGQITRKQIIESDKLLLLIDGIRTGILIGEVQEAVQFLLQSSVVVHAR